MQTWTFWIAVEHEFVNWKKKIWERACEIRVELIKQIKRQVVTREHNAVINQPNETDCFVAM